MCIFTQPVISVNNTQIFARLDGSGKQFLVYQMNYESRDQNAMILPIPVKQSATGDVLRFVDLKHYEEFFEDLAEGFPYHQPSPGISCSAEPGVKSALKVFEVGNYISSFVPTLSDFDRLDAKFKLPD